MDPCHKSRAILEGPDRAPARSHFKAVSFTDEDLTRPIVGVAHCWIEITGRAMAEQWGLPAYRFLVMPHPIANLTEAELDQRAREIAPQVVTLLLKGQD